MTLLCGIMSLALTGACGRKFLPESDVTGAYLDHMNHVDVTFQDPAPSAAGGTGEPREDTTLKIKDGSGNTVSPGDSALPINQVTLVVPTLLIDLQESPKESDELFVVAATQTGVSNFTVRPNADAPLEMRLKQKQLTFSNINRYLNIDEKILLANLATQLQIGVDQIFLTQAKLRGTNPAQDFPATAAHSQCTFKKENFKNGNFEAVPFFCRIELTFASDAPVLGLEVSGP